MANFVQLTPQDFSKTLGEFMKEHARQCSIVKAHYFDERADDMYQIKMQVTMGALRGRVDCIPKLGMRNAWQVDRSQPAGLTIGELLLLIASAPLETDPAKFFS